jgi:hypothetical protein
MNNWFKQNGMHFAIIGIFLAICFFYFTPAFNGKTLGQSDVVGAQSTQKEINDYRAKGETILWTNQIFGGMPAYQIWAPLQRKRYHLGSKSLPKQPSQTRLIPC